MTDEKNRHRNAYYAFEAETSMLNYDRLLQKYGSFYHWTLNFGYIN